VTTTRRLLSGRLTHRHVVIVDGIVVVAVVVVVVVSVVVFMTYRRKESSFWTVVTWTTTGHFLSGRLTRRGCCRSTRLLIRMDDCYTALSALYVVLAYTLITSSFIITLHYM